MDMFNKYDFLSLSCLNSGEKDGRRERENGMEKRERRGREEREGEERQTNRGWGDLHIRM